MHSVLPQNELLSWCNISHWHEPYAITLTLRLRSREGQYAQYLAHQAPPEYTQNFRHFMNKLNKAAYKNSATRGLKRIRVIPVLEQDRSGRHHYHAAIDRPSHIAHPQFCSLISETWEGTRWGYKHNDIIRGADDGWTKYMLKRRSKRNWFDAIDWENFYNNLTADV